MAPDASVAVSVLNIFPYFIATTGIFGVSTALWMYKRGGYSVTILDKSSIVPAPDAASTDINKIIRWGDYADPSIAALNVDAVNEWRKPVWEGTYHECVGRIPVEASS